MNNQDDIYRNNQPQESGSDHEDEEDYEMKFPDKYHD